MVYRSALHPALLAQPQPRGPGSASCLQQTRIRTVCAGCCCLTDGLGVTWPPWPTTRWEPNSMDICEPKGALSA